MKTEVIRYKRGTNEYLDTILNDEVVWIIQGPKGRLPIIADTEEEALGIYGAIRKSYKTMHYDDEE